MFSVLQVEEYGFTVRLSGPRAPYSLLRPVSQCHACQRHARYLPYKVQVRRTECTLSCTCPTSDLPLNSPRSIPCKAAYRVPYGAVCVCCVVCDVSSPVRSRVWRGNWYFFYSILFFFAKVVYEKQKPQRGMLHTAAERENRDRGILICV